MIELRKKKAERTQVASNLPEYGIRVNLNNNYVAVTRGLFDGLNLSNNYLGVGCDRENDKYYICLSDEKTGFKPNAKTLAFTNKKLVEDWKVWYSVGADATTLYFKVNFESPITQDNITYYQSELIKTEVKQLELV